MEGSCEKWVLYLNMSIKSILHLVSSKHDMQWQEWKKNWENKKLKHDHVNGVMTNKTRKFPHNNLKEESVLFTASNEAKRRHLCHLPGPVHPPPFSSFIIKLFVSFVLSLLRNHNTNRKSLNITYNFRRENPKQLIKTWKAQSNCYVFFTSSSEQQTFYSANKLNFIFDIRYKSNVKITNWGIHCIKLATFSTYWKKDLCLNIHLLSLKVLKQWRLF